MEAEIVEWFVKPGDEVHVDQALVAMETAKAIVQVPSPINGRIVALMGQAGEVIHTGEVLVEFEGDAEDTGTVVGKLSKAKAVKRPTKRIQINKEALARDFEQKDYGALEELRQLGLKTKEKLSTESLEKSYKDQTQGSLRGVKKSMAQAMRASQASVVPASLIDEADVTAWRKHEDVTVHLLMAMAEAVKIEPALNALYFAERQDYQIQEEVNIGLAVDTDDGLFVPVIRNVSERKSTDLRQAIEQIRIDIKARSIPLEELQGATISLTNFGMIAGLFGTPIIVPPQVAILGAGHFRKRLVKEADDIVEKTYLPLSLTFDHQVITGAEAARFLKAIMTHLN